MLERRSLNVARSTNSNMHISQTSPTDLALYYLNMLLIKSVQDKDIAITTFVDIDGAFNSDAQEGESHSWYHHHHHSHNV